MGKFQTKKFIYFIVAMITIVMATVCFPFSGKAVAEETEIKYNELTVSQLQTMRVLAEEEINSYIKKELYLHYKSERLLRDFDNNEYIIYSFSPCGYAIYSLLNFDMIEIAPFNISPYNNVNGDLLYMPMVGYYKKTGNSGLLDVEDGTTITLNAEMLSALTEQSREFTKKAMANINLSTKKKVSSAKYSLPKDIDMEIVQRQAAVLQNIVYKKEQLNSSSGDDWDLPVSDGIILADYEVSDAWYFKLNTYQFAHPSSDTCGYKALGLIVCYHEYFSCTGYFTADESSKYISVASGPFGTTVPEVKDDLVDYLKGSRSDTSTPWDVASACYDFMKGKDISFEHYGDILGIDSIEEQIRKNSPTILFGSMSYNFSGGKKNHAVVVYGYFNNGKLLVHYGHAYKSQVILSNYITGGYYGIINKSGHRHNTRYFKNGKVKYCGCGMIMMVTC